VRSKRRGRIVLVRGDGLVEGVEELFDLLEELFIVKVKRLI
jgi:hypothetical protein